METPAPPLCTGAFMHISSENGNLLCITKLSLVDPAMARGQRVNVWAEVGEEKRAIGELSSREPFVTMTPVVLGGEFMLRHNLPVVDAVQLHVRVLAPSATSSDGQEEDERVILLGVHEEDAEEEETDDEDDDGGVGTEYELLSDNEGGFGAGCRSNRKDGSSVVPDGEFLGPARFAAVENTAAFMRVAAGGDEESKEIVVLYRYTRFSSSTRGGQCSVEPCRRTKLHRLRFVVPHSGDLVSSLAMAGSSLGPLIYPGLFRQNLHDLWKSLAAPATGTIPPVAARLLVVVDAGILRREDYSPERMAHVRGALATRMMDAWPAHYHVGMELHLPAPVSTSRRIGDDEEGEDECCVCFELLQSGMAAWPGCGHVFHGACLEKAMERSQMCPLCRRKLSDPIAHKNNIKMHP